jgi:hypothetical protein
MARFSDVSFAGWVEDPATRLEANVGPLQFMIVQFDGNHFNGEILPELDHLREQKLIRVLDLVFVKRDADGSVSSTEMSDLAPEAARPKASLDEESGHWFADEDLEQVGNNLEDNSSVAMVLIEHLWAQPLREATLRANGRLIADGMVPTDVVDEIEAALKAGAELGG